MTTYRLSPLISNDSPEKLDAVDLYHACNQSHLFEDAERCVAQALTKDRAMPIPMTSNQVLDREFFEIRAKILELAASFDRLDRADGSVDGDPRLSLIHEALSVLASDQEDRAEQIQLLFSRHYEDDWREKFDLASTQ